MKKRFLLFIITVLLSVGAWAENLWSGEANVNGWGFTLTESKSMSVGDILTFTISIKTNSWDNITLNTIDTSKGYNSPGTLLKTITAEVGKVILIVDEDIATAATNGLWVSGGDCTVTSVDYEKAVGVNLYTNAEGNTMNYWSMQLSSPNLLYAKASDVLRVTISAVGTNDYWRKLFLQDTEGDANGESYTGNKLYTCENTSLTAGTLDIRLTDELIAKAQGGSLHIGGFDYTFTAVDLYLTSPTVTISSAGYATFGYPVALDLTGIEAYTAVVSGDKVVLSSVKGKKIPAGTGIILEGSGDVTIPLTTEATDDITGNELLVSDGTVTGDGSTIYVLANKTPNGVGFYKLSSGKKVLAGKAYLKVTGGDSRSFIGFGDDATGIDEVSSKEGRSNYFDLQGRRVLYPTKGLYIVNGKKVLVP